MRQKLVITDVTQMPNPDEVCVVGLNEYGESVRPICEEGFKKIYCFKDHKLSIYPKSVVEIDILDARPEPPHCEDKYFDPHTIMFIRECQNDEWEQLLIKSGFPSIERIYYGYFVSLRYVLPGTGRRSIGTLTNVSVDELMIEKTRASVKPRLKFNDGAGRQYNLPVSDLIIRDRCYDRVKRNSEEITNVARDMTADLKSARKVYLRIGLARPWIGDYTSELRCYPQVTAIHIIPQLNTWQKLITAVKNLSQG